MSRPPKPAWESELVWQFFGCRPSGFFVDGGANEPKRGSQSWFLEQKGWRGILVEPQADLCARLHHKRPGSKVFQVACGAPGHPPELVLHIAEDPAFSSLERNCVAAETTYVRSESVKVLTLEEILSQAGNPALDFVSIDVEGAQLNVLRGFSLARHHPALLLIEDHLHDLKVHRWMKRHGYRLVKRTGLNNWYVAKGTFFKTTIPDRLRLFKKVWLNTPFRKLRVFLECRRARTGQPESAG